MWLSAITARPETRQQWVKRAPAGMRRWHLARDYARFMARESARAATLLARIQQKRKTTGHAGEARSMFSAGDLRVAVFGSWDEQWLDALGPESEIWRGLDPVREVRLFDGAVSELASHAVAAESPLLVLPLVEKHALPVPDALRTRIPPREAIQLLAHKARGAAYLGSRWPENQPRRFMTLKQVEYPCVIKPSMSSGCVGVAVIESEEALLEALESHWLAGEDVVIEALVPGDREQVTHAMCADGKVLWECSFDKPRCLYPTVAPADLPSEIRLVATSPRVRALLRELVADLGYSGPLCADYRICDGVPKIFEINPRFGGSLMEPWSRSLLREAVMALVDSMPSHP